MSCKRFFSAYLCLISTIIFWFFGFDKLYLSVPDGLDGNHAFYHSLSIKQWLLSFNAYLPQIHGGQGALRDALGSEFIIGNLFHILLPTKYAYLVNELIMRSMAYWGGYYFLGKMGVKSDFIKIGSSILISLLGYWHFGYAAQAGMLLYTYLLIRMSEPALERDGRKKIFFFFFTYPLYSPLFLGFNFYIFSFLTCLFYFHGKWDSLQKVFKYLLALGVIHLLTDWRLIYTTFFNSEFQIHKVWKFYGLSRFNLDEFLNYFWIFFQWQNYHSHSNVIKPVLFIIVLFSIGLAIKVVWRRGLMEIEKNFYFLFLYIVVSSGLSSMFHLIGLDSPFDFTRVFFPNQFLWYCCLAMFFSALQGVVKPLRVTINLVFCAIFFLQAWQIITNAFPGRSIRTPELSYEEFYSCDLFEELRKDLNKIDYKVERTISIGLHPSVALYNGFKTVDGYLWNYNKAYKFKFLKLWQDDFLRTSERTQNYILGEGGRLYYLHPAVRNTSSRGVFPKFGRYLPRLRKDSLNLDKSLVEELKLNLIISNRVKFSNSSDSGFRFFKSYGSEEGPYLLHIYIKN